MQKNAITLTLILLLCPFKYVTNAQTINIIPMVDNHQPMEGKFQINNSLKLSAKDKSLKKVASTFIEQLTQLTEFKGAVKSCKADIILSLSTTIENPEAYQLNITPKRIEIKGGSESGVFYGLQTLLQLINNSTDQQISCMEISDEPRYEWRGFMLDESRHFFGPEEVKKILDMMALHKLNIFHWHLTDSQGWRIEIKKYPLLTEVGGKGNNSDPDAPAKFYSQHEINEIISYAKARFIEVIPEIDMPGHATAAVKAYPEFGGGGSEKHPDFTFHPGKEGTYQFLTDILREVAELFPSQFIHVGGDEVHFGNKQWSTFPEVQALMQRENMKDLTDVEHYFINRMADSIQYLGKTVIGWDEVISAGLKKDQTRVMWWRHDKPQLLKDAVNKGYEVVLCPRRPLYFDFVQHDSHKYGRRWGGFCPIEYENAFPNPEMTGGESYKSDLIKGIQANVWTETMHTSERLEFMIFPRLSALSEAACNNDSNIDLISFFIRLNTMFTLYKKQGIKTFDPANPENSPEVKGAPKK